MYNGGKTIWSSGNKFDSEIPSDAKDWLTERANRGNAVLIPKEGFRNTKDAIEAIRFWKSNDADVLACAKFSGAGVLCAACTLVESINAQNQMERQLLYVNSEYNLPLLC